MKISIVIPTLQEEDYIGLLLTDLSHQKKKPFEVIVVDCGSKDKTRKIASSFSFVKVLRAPKGASVQRNKGLASCRGDLIIFLDADVRLEPDFLMRFEKYFADSALSVAIPNYIPEPGTFTLRFFYTFVNWMHWLHQWFNPLGAGSCIAIRNNKRITPFRTNILVGEDVAFVRDNIGSGKFRVFSIRVAVSDRRFRKYGFFKMMFRYMRIGILLSFGKYKAASRVEYRFADY